MTLARLLNVSDAEIGQLVKAGLPTEGRGKFSANKCVLWYVRHLQTTAAAMSDRNRATSMDKRHFASLFGISENQLERLFQQGMPSEKTTARKIAIPMPAGRVWYHNYLIEKGRRQAAPKDIDDAKHRKMTAEADLAELTLSKARDELMTVETYERVVTDAFARADARLQTLAPRLGGVVLGATSITDAQSRMAPIIEEVREELREADDVPRVDDDEETDDDADDDDDEDDE